ncbi:ribonuclease III family protein [Thermofilum pendens]|nr:ribonuclease III family protein [Thermofilum pendens]
MLKEELEKVLRSKELARLGDSLVNFLVSAALTLIGRPTGVKVPGETLARAFLSSRLSKLGKPRGIAPGEAMEAFLAYAWLKGSLSCEESVEMLYTGLREGYDVAQALAKLADYLLEKIEAD